MKTNRSPYKNFAALCATVFLLASCEREVDFTGQLPDAKIVINSFVEPGAPIMAAVSRSRNIVEDYSPNLLPDAEVLLYINGELQPPMQAYAPPLPDDWSGGNLLWTHASPSVAREGDAIRIVAKQEGYSDASAEIVVPGKAAILSIDTIRFNDQYSSNAMRFLIKFKDLDTGAKNYYRLGVEYEFSDDKINWRPDPNYLDFNYSQDPALSDGFKSATDELMGTGTENRYGLFSNDLFNGKEYTLNISFSPRYSGEYDWVYDEETGETIQYERITHYRYLFKLLTLSPSTYMYLKSRTFYATITSKAALASSAPSKPTRSASSCRFGQATKAKANGKVKS